MSRRSRSYEYWRAREALNDMMNRKEEAGYQKQLNSYYDRAMDEIQKEIDSFYEKYAASEGITMAEARRRISQVDIDEYSRKAKRYVKEKNFTDRANAEMKLYNATMKINRLELLKAKIGLETVAANSDAEKLMKQILKGRTVQEIERQAGILGKSIGANAKTINSIVNASFHNAKWSERIWSNQELLKAELSKLLTNGITQGKSSRELAQGIRKAMGATKNNADRLMRTELSRVRNDVQLQSFKRNGYEEYTYLTLSSAGYTDGKVCPICAELDGKHFKVKDAVVGDNMPPMHPNCRCSISAYEDSEEYEAWLDFLDKGGTTAEWNKFGKAAWQGNNTIANLARAIDSMHLIDEDNARYSREVILEEMQKSPVGIETIRAIRDSNVSIQIDDSDRADGARGQQSGNNVSIFLSNIKNARVAAQTLIHEMAHYRFGIGGCQYAEAICFAMEKMHIEGRDYLTPSEWEYVKQLAIDNYPEYNWIKGGYGDYEQFSFIKDE